MPKLKSRDDLIAQGRNARSRGRARCPFRLDTFSGDAWIEGWRARDAELKKPKLIKVDIECERNGSQLFIEHDSAPGCYPFCISMDCNYFYCDSETINKIIKALTKLRKKT